MKRMKALCVAVFVYAVGCGKTIKPEKIVVENQRIQGKFTISTSILDGILSQGTGGACLVADLNQLNVPKMPDNPDRTCSKDAECSLVPEGWAGYCDKKGRRRCWVRPGAGDDKKLCNKSLMHDGAPWPDGTHVSNEEWFPTKPIVIPTFPCLPNAPCQTTVYNGALDWRVVACLNGLNVNAEPKVDTKDCGTGGERRMELLGEIANVP